jgi:hypothetical protein
MDNRCDGENCSGDDRHGEDEELATRLHEAQEHYSKGELDHVCAEGVEEVADEEEAVGEFCGGGERGWGLGLACCWGWGDGEGDELVYLVVDEDDCVDSEEELESAS